jgi:hypothetical protein
MIILLRLPGADTGQKIDESPLRGPLGFLVLTKSTFGNHRGHVRNELFPRSALWVIS